MSIRATFDASNPHLLRIVTFNPQSDGYTDWEITLVMLSQPLKIAAAPSKMPIHGILMPLLGLKEPATFDHSRKRIIKLAGSILDAPVERVSDTNSEMAVDCHLNFIKLESERFDLYGDIDIFISATSKDRIRETISPSSHFSHTTFVDDLVVDLPMPLTYVPSLSDKDSINAVAARSPLIHHRCQELTG